MKPSKFANFINSSAKIVDCQNGETFYVYPDKIQSARYELPTILESAYGNGFLTIGTKSAGRYYLEIGNQLYENSSLWELEQILFNWSLSEGYEWD